MIEYTIEGRLPNLNDYIHAMNSNRQAGNRMKQDTMDYIGWQLNPVKAVESAVIVHFQWYEQDRRRDLDNVSSAGRKFILDALVKRGILKGDGWKHVIGFTDKFYVDKERPRIVVKLEEQDG